MRRLNKERGAITLFVLIAMMFFIMALVGTFIIIANRAKNQKQINEQVQSSYQGGDEGSIYESYFGGEIVPIYNNDQLRKIDSEEYIAINDEGGKVYNFTTSAKYVLRNDIIIYAKDFDDGDAIWTEIKEKLDSLEGRFETAGHIITLVTLTGTKLTYPPTLDSLPELDSNGILLSNYTVKYGNNSFEQITIPAGFTLANLNQDGIVTGVKTRTDWEKYLSVENIQKGIVITDLAANGNEFVWVPVQNAVLDCVGKTEAQITTAISAEVSAGRYPMAIKLDSINYRSVGYTFAINGGVVVPTPITYSATGNHEPDTVTEDATSSNMTLADCEGMTTATFKNYLQVRFNRMVQSVEKYGGFYAGRYESSVNSGNAQSKPNVAPMTGAANSGNTWYGMFAKQKAYSTSANMSNVTSDMIWGCQWDQTMLWMKDIKNVNDSSTYYIINPTGMGWFSGNTSVVKDTGTSVTANYNKVKEIYDLGGNVREWTLEVNSTANRNSRGGNIGGVGTANPPSLRAGVVPTGTGTQIGSRMQLFIDIDLVEPVQKEHTYAYTGVAQTFTVEVSGKYKIQAWGAQRRRGIHCGWKRRIFRRCCKLNQGNSTICLCWREGNSNWYRRF